MVVGLAALIIECIIVSDKEPPISTYYCLSTLSYIIWI